MSKRIISVTILEDHQSIVDGYQFRLEEKEDIKVVASVAYGEDLDIALAKHPTDVLFLDVSVPISEDNHSPYPILFVIPRLRKLYPEMAIVVISVHNEYSLIKSIIDAGANSYILKSDSSAIQNLQRVVHTVVDGSSFLSRQVQQILFNRDIKTPDLTARQVQVLSLFAADTSLTSDTVSEIMGITSSTIRNLLSSAYSRLKVNNRTAAIAEARRFGIIPPVSPIYRRR